MRSGLRKSTAGRGYGSGHQRLRRTLAPYVAAGVCVCGRCGLPVRPGEAWDVDHTDDRRGYRENPVAHARCNRGGSRFRPGNEEPRW